MSLQNWKIEQVWHPWHLWEEVSHNMWGTVSDRSGYLEQAIEFTGDHKRYGHFMKRVALEWPISCENALTDPHLNHKAWIGHAACALAFKCPEDIVRQAWSYLNDGQKYLANQEASRTIRDWRIRYCKDRGIRSDMGEQSLF